MSDYVIVSLLAVFSLCISYMTVKYLAFKSELNIEKEKTKQMRLQNYVNFDDLK